MNIFTNHTAIEGIRIHGFFSSDEGKALHFEGAYRSGPHAEAKISGTLDYEDAKRLIEQLTGALKTIPCPTCGHKDAP